MKEIFAQMLLNLCTDEENFCMDIVKRIHVWRKFFERMWLNGWTANKNFWTNKVEQINDWRKHFLKDEWLKKIIIFQRMRSIGQHYGTAPVDTCRPQNRGSHDYLRAHKGISLETKISILNSQMLAFCGTPFILAIKILKAKLQTFHSNVLMRES